MMHDESEAAVRQLLLDQPDLEFFYILYLAYSTGSVGDNTFHSLATDPQRCRDAIQHLCVEQKTKLEEIIAELKELPANEEPYDPFLPDGCYVILCIILPDKQHYVWIQSQRWHNQGQSLHPADVPDIFDVVYYSEKVRRGDYHRDSVKT